MRVPFQPWFVIVDEAGFSLEADSLIPCISQDIVTILLAGDHEQLQPIVTSYGNNNYCKQVQVSLFDRLVSMDIHFICLRSNHRMPLEMADLPVIMIYNGLL